ncbi:RNA polymerase sigma factor [Amycolatopsis anabasis]|uniref:RNA polymerase sigma factor n=1 Tax=Amycolatopsis anabasis TaxID=1840409 RepID=UPI00131C6611|nr:sigma-70 family RNA polymerase sigma factor [Amycolatopsis anabasis]
MGAQLTDRVRAGSVRDFEPLFRDHVQATRDYAGSLVRAQEVDELVSETFERVLNALLRGRGPTDEGFLAYSKTTLRHVLADRYRERRRERLEEDIELAAVDLDPMLIVVSENAARGENVELIRAVRGLPLRWRLIVWLIDIEQQPIAEVARLLAMKPNAVHALAYRARKRLRETLAEPLSPRR